MEWKETARWVKFEEDVEEGGDKWSKPHVATLSLHSLFELRSLMLKGTFLLDLPATNLAQISGQLATGLCMECVGSFVAVRTATRKAGAMSDSWERVRVRVRVRVWVRVRVRVRVWARVRAGVRVSTRVRVSARARVRVMVRASDSARVRVRVRASDSARVRVRVRAIL